MKKSAILCSVLVGALCVIVARHALEFAAIPVSFKPHWLTIIPVLVIWAVSIGFLIRKESAVAEQRTQKAQAEVVMKFTAAGEPLV